jgi:hypothetical protein
LPGFSQNSFDRPGRSHENDGGMSIDNSGAVLEAGQFDGAAEFRQQLLRPKEHRSREKKVGG